MISRGYHVLFVNKQCIISDPKGKKIIEIQMVQKKIPVKWNDSAVSKKITHEEEMILQNEKVEMSRDVTLPEDDESKFTRRYQ